MESFITTDYVMGFAIGFCLVVLVALVARGAAAASRKASADPPAVVQRSGAHGPDSGKRADHESRRP